MLIKFKNKTFYTNNLYDSYCDFHRFITIIKQNIQDLIIFLSLMFLLLFSLQSRNTLLIFGVNTILFIFLLYKFCISYLDTITKYEVTNSCENTEFNFTFYDTYFHVNSKNCHYAFKYTSLYQVCITKDFTYLYSDKDHAFVLDNKNFTFGDLNTFKLFLKDKCKSKYQDYEYMGA